MANLQDLFRYDLWANQLWLEFLLAHGTDEEQDVFTHILKGQMVWSSRLKGVSLLEFPTINLTAKSLHDLNQAWLGHINNFAADSIIEYRRFNGDPMAMTFDHIATHVANHGTYHRGHLRGLCQARGCTEFPETDFILFQP
jgi:uncharacterized damage-inducible protein DinB